MKVAIFGCLHGMLDEMYQAIEDHENSTQETIDFVIVCGDCQTIRHFDDLKCLSVPDKYKKVGSFPDYYSGKKKIPKLTIFIGGNHEASNYLMTLPYGGWVCDNFYYLGYAGVVRYRGLRIAGVSGIHNTRNCNKGRFERMPLNDQTIKSVYHTRRVDIFRLQLLSKNAEEHDPIDVFLSHDWPTRIYDYGNKLQLLRFKPAFRSDIESREGLGNPMTRPLINQLKPRRWFAAHLHCKFYAKVEHDRDKNRITEFLSLNKIENRRHYMEVLDLEGSRHFDESSTDLYYDEEWLTILRKTMNLEINSGNNVYCPRIDEESGRAYLPTAEEIQVTVDMMNKTGGLKIQRNFKMTEPVIYFRPNSVQPSLDSNRLRNHPNPQNEELCSRLKLHEQKDSGFKNEPQSCGLVKSQPNVHIKTEPNIKQEPNTTTQEKKGSNIKLEHGVKLESNDNGAIDPPTKKRPPLPKNEPIELDDDGCLPFYIDTKGDK